MRPMRRRFALVSLVATLVFGSRLALAQTAGVQAPPVAPPAPATSASASASTPAPSVETPQTPPSAATAPPATPATPKVTPPGPPVTRVPIADPGPSAAEVPPSDPIPGDPIAPKPVLPLELRGAIGLDTASFTEVKDDVSAVAIRLVSSMSIADHVYLDARLPLGLAMDRTTAAVLGNPMLGVHGVLPLGKSTWLSVGGALGLPLLSGRTQRNGYGALQTPSALWDIHEYTPSVLPIELRAGIQSRFDMLTIRAELAPVVMFPVGRSEQIEMVLLHAVELQVGQTFGAGLRFQGVEMPTTTELEYKNTPAFGSHYQAALEPFVSLQKPGYYLRTGLMMPLDEPLGPPLATSFGFRLAFGIRLD